MRLPTPPPAGRRRAALVALASLASTAFALAPPAARPAGAQVPSCLPPLLGVPGPGTTFLYAKRAQVWYVRFSESSGPGDSCFVFGNPGDVGIMGDWDADGRPTPGVYRPETSTFYLSNDPLARRVDGVFRFGEPGDVPAIGDWDDNGSDSIGVLRPSTLTWHLPAHNEAPDARWVVPYGDPGDIPLRGGLKVDRKSSRVDLSLSLYRPSDRTFYRRAFLHVDQPGRGPEVCGSTSPPPQCLPPSVFDVWGSWGNDGDRPVWDRRELGVLRRPSTSQVFLQRNDPDNPEAALVFGDQGDQILVSR